MKRISSPTYPARLFLTVILALTPLVVRADAGSVRTEVDANKLGADDTLTLSVVLEGDAAGLDASLPSLQNLVVVAGPSTSTQISFVNGAMSRQKVLSFVLRAQKPGAASIGPVSVQGYPPTAPIAIDVVPGSIRPAQPQDPFGRDPFGGRDPFEEIFGRTQRPAAPQGKLFVEATLSRPAARVGEPVLVTYFVYTQISLSGVEFASAPKYPGFWAEEIDRKQGDSSGENTFVKGEAFLRYPVLERLLFPTKPGVLEIPEARLRLVPAGGMFGVAAPIERSTRGLKLKVDPLPPGVPEGGAVGSYEVDASTDQTSIALGDALTYRFRVRGRGNLKWIDAAPALDLPEARIFPPRVTSDLRATRQGIEGTKTWEFVIVPEKAGTFEIPSVPFSYFDPGAQSLRTEKTQPIPIQVGAAPTSPGDTPKNSTQAVALRGELDAAQGDLTRVAWTMAGLSMALQAYAWRRRKSAPQGKQANRAALAAAQADLESADILSGTKERSAARISGALERAFGPRTEWPSDDLGDQLRSLSDELEFLRFAPQLGSYDQKLKEVRDRAVAILAAQR